MKKSVYIDSTIPSYCFDKREELRFPSKVTRDWWKEESQNYEIFISLETIAELSRGNYPN